MPSPSPDSDAAVQASGGSSPPGDPSVASNKAGSGALADSPAEAAGRRILSTAFVRIGPDGHLTVDMHDGSALVLRDVVMLPGRYCGSRVVDGVAGARYCGAYSEVAAARPGGGPAR